MAHARAGACDCPGLARVACLARAACRGARALTRVGQSVAGDRMSPAG
jgi:hypothetical protein